jgi:hypothetical protein
LEGGSQSARVPTTAATEENGLRSLASATIRVTQAFAPNRRRSVFLPFVQMSDVAGMSYEIRTRMNPETLLPALRHVAQQIAPDLLLSSVRTQQQQIDPAM